MLDRKLQSWFYPEPTGDVGRDRNARTLQFSCFLLAFAVGAVLTVSAIDREWQETPLLVFAIAGFIAAAVMNRAGRSDWAGRTAFLVVLLGAILLVFEAHDGFRSHSMLIFPGLLLICVMMLDRASYVVTAGIVVVAVAALGIAVKDGLTRATPPVRTTYDSIFYVDVNMLVIAIIGSRIARDAQRNVFDLRASVERLSVANFELTKAAEALRRSESLARARTAELQAIMDAAPAVILVASDAECRHVGGNQTAYAMMRQKPGTNLSLAAPEGERPTNRRVMQNGIEIPLNEMPLHKAAFTGQPIRNYDLEVVFEDGTSIDLLGNVEPIPGEKGGPRGVVAVLSDITERKQAEAALRESEQRFRNMADTAPVMIWVTGPDKLFTFVNKTWLDFTGRTMEEELGNGWSAGVHPDDLQRCYEAYCSAFDARQNFQLECRLRRRDGEYRSILSSGVPRFAPEGIFAGYIGSDIDITDLQSEERFRQLAENIDQVFWMLDLGTQQMLYVSPVFEKVWGCSSAGLYQNRDWLVESVHAEDRDRFTAFLTKVKSVPAEESYRIVRPDGAVRWIHDRAFLVYDPEGKPYRVGGIAEDVTAHRELEEQLRQAHKMEAVGRLAGGVAHDFNNLLTIIAGYSKMLLDGTATTDPRREGLEQILNAGNRASILTRQLLAFSRRQVLQPKVVNLNHLLTNMRALLRPLVGEHITIETELDPEVSCIKVDPHQIEQVVMNLAANARDAMANGGQFRIQTSMANPAEHQAENCPCGVGECVRLRISDTGCGMDDRTRERAFEPFFTTKGLGKGTGLGLSTVYGIVRQNQGEIHVSSELGRGTVFDLYFPAVAESEAESEVPANQHPKTWTTETILVAEDEPRVRGLVKQTLEQLGYTVLEATDGYEALRVIEQHQSEIHLVLTDVVMPLMNGLELATRLHSIRPGTKVLYMSGYADEVLAFHGIAQPEIAFIQKPFTPSELAGKVETVLSADSGKRPGFEYPPGPPDESKLI